MRRPVVDEASFVVVVGFVFMALFGWFLWQVLSWVFG